VGAHPHSYGFPPGHPEMKTFLGVPVLVRGVPYGNLYLTEKAGGEEFTEEDEQTIVLLAEFAGVAIDHARRYSGLEAQHIELTRTVDALDATMQIARALGGETDLDAILGLVAKRGRALVSARALVIEHEQAGEMVVAAGAGEMPAGLLACGSGSSCWRELSRSPRRPARARGSTSCSPRPTAPNGGYPNRGRRAPSLSRNHAPDPRARIGEAAPRAPPRLDQLKIGGVGRDEPDRSRSQRLGGERLVHVHRGDDDLGGWRRRAQRLDPLGAEPVRHPQVEHEHVGALDAHLAHTGLELGRLADDVQIGLALE
jgi:hypothetical protein